MVIRPRIRVIFCRCAPEGRRGSSKPNWREPKLISDLDKAGRFVRTMRWLSGFGDVSAPLLSPKKVRFALFVFFFFFFYRFNAQNEWVKNGTRAKGDRSGEAAGKAVWKRPVVLTLDGKPLAILFK